MLLRLSMEFGESLNPRITQYIKLSGFYDVVTFLQSAIKNSCDVVSIKHYLICCPSC